MREVGSMKFCRRRAYKNLLYNINAYVMLKVVCTEYMYLFHSCEFYQGLIISYALRIQCRDIMSVVSCTIVS